MSLKKIICGFGMASGTLLGIGILCKLNHWENSSIFLTAGICCMIVFVNFFLVYYYSKTE